MQGQPTETGLTMPPEAVRAPRAQQQRLEKILTAGVKLFEKRGFGRTTMDEIAAAAGVTKRTLYRYVSSKPQFLEMIHAQFLDAAEAMLPEHAQGSVVERIEAFVRSYLTVIIKHQRAVRVFFEQEYHLKDEARAHVVKRRDEFENHLRQLLRDGQATGEIRDFDVSIASSGLFGAMAGTYKWYKPTGSLSALQVVDLVTDIVLHGVEDPRFGRPPSASPVFEQAGPITDGSTPPSVLDAAVEVFAERGYAEASTQEVADAAGMTKSALFYHIGSKDELLYDIHRTFAQRTLDDLALWTSAAEDPAATLRTVVVNHAIVMSEYRAWVRVFTDQDRYLRDADRRTVEALRAQYVAGIAEIIENGTRAGEFRPIDPQVEALTVVGMLNWMSRWFQPKGRLDAATVGREFARLIAHGVLAPQSSS